MHGEILKWFKRLVSKTSRRCKPREGSNPSFSATYIEQTDTIVSPMLSRIGKCRTLIKKETDGKLDILDDKQFWGYKRYLGDL